MVLFKCDIIRCDFDGIVLFGVRDCNVIFVNLVVLVNVVDGVMIIIGLVLVGMVSI